MIIFLFAQLICIIVLLIFLLKYSKSTVEFKKCISEKDSMIESLRVVNHDFKNKMHVLMGYIETDRWDNAKSFINTIRTVPTSEIAQITRIIKVPSVSSLVIGKVIEAKELGIQVCVMPDSRCESITQGILESDYITIIGNLIQNAIEELEMHGGEERCIDLYIKTSEDWSIISVTDNGNGMSDEEQKYIFDMGYSTKPGDNRGVGLCSVKKICEKYSGIIEIESEKGKGCAINIILNRNGRRR